MRPRTTALALLVLCSKCLTIRVPTVWNSDSEVRNEQSSLETSEKLQQQPIPVEYFQYTAKKPQFAAEIAAFHGVQNPESHYKAYPIRPYTGREKPQLGQHQLLNENKPVFHQFQDFTRQNEELKEVIPVSANYEVFHPYKAEEPGLQALYKDPVLDKIRNDIRNSQNRLQSYEKEAGKPDITEDEYLERPEQTDRKKFPHRNVPAQYEIHRPQRRPIYYRRPPKYTHDHILNHRFRHPWNQHNAKIRPLHYQPLRNHLHNLRQNHALKYDDERNEYPQLPPPESYAEPADGYDIYERGKDKYVQLRNNVDESINNAIKENRPTIHQKLELQNNGDKTVTQISDGDVNDEEEFVPIKNYAQVRKTETVKHLPREAAFEDAASFDEIRNAPRLREAVKSTKAQTVYTEEGYEDAAYDHAGEQKHASENEAHAGILKENEISGGKFKTPSVSAQYEDGTGSAYRDQKSHGEKWNNDDKDSEQEDDEEDFSEDETEKSVEAEIYEDVTGERNKREDILVPDSNNTGLQHEVNKRETKFKIPEIDLNSTFLNEDDSLKIAKLKLESKNDNIKEKYPYYFKNLKEVNRDSPLRYAENLKFIPKKSKGGTEFYDSRLTFECPEVEDNIDPLPETLKKGGHPESDETDEDEVSGEENNGQKKKGEANFDHLKGKPRLKGLGDKIDCFKAKYFGENPLDSPFFKEEIISNPEPLTIPKLPIFNVKSKEILSAESKHNNVYNQSEKLRKESETDIFNLLHKLNNGQKNLQESLIKSNNELRASLLTPQNISNIGGTELAQQSNVYSDILGNIKNNLQIPILSNDNLNVSSQLTNQNQKNESNVRYKFYQNKEDVTKQPTLVRKKRASPFVYEPYKIIKDGQVQESKKTTTTNNISPLIKQLQSSRVVDRVSKANQDIEQPVKRNVATRAYKDIGRQDRAKAPKKDNENNNAAFIDVNEGTRRGEPKYELRPSNHKSEYTPVENKKAMSVEDYKTQANNTKNQSNETSKQAQTNSRQSSRRRGPTTTRPYFDVSQFLPKTAELQKQSASRTHKKIVKVPESESELKKTEKKGPENEESSDDEEDYEDYEDDEEEITTTTTTRKPSFRRRRTKPTTTTAKPEEELAEEDIEQELPKLRLITRFRTSTQAPTTSLKPEILEIRKETPKHESDEDEKITPKYSEKKKKSTQRTLVTDTQTYGDGDDDMMKDEVDAMIGVREDMDDYMPQYEKDIEKKNKDNDSPMPSQNHEEEEEDDDDEDNDDDEFIDDEEEEDDEEDDDEGEEEEEHESIPEITTPEPTKRTLPRTTEAPVSTTEARSSRLELKPIVMKKKIEIHKELPVNKSSPHITQFKQDIREVEIIKEVPLKPSKLSKKPLKNIEALELYKDENLAKDVNKLGGVEIFKEDLDLKNGPRHGGNYRSEKLIELNEDDGSTPEPLHGGNLKIPKDDTEASQSDTKPIELGGVLPARRLHGGNLKSHDDSSKPRNSGKSAKLELDETFDKSTSILGMHGGNLRKERRRGGNKNAKLIDIEDDSAEKDNMDHRSTHVENFKSYGRGNTGRMHGGNYRSAKLVQTEDKEELKQPEKLSKERKENINRGNMRNNAAALLNSLAQAVPMLTTTPAYILDPSKRMYYYVDA